MSPMDLLRNVRAQSNPFSLKNQSSKRRNRNQSKQNPGAFQVAAELLEDRTLLTAEIQIDGDFSDWDSVQAYYDPADDQHDTDPRGPEDVPEYRDHPDVDILTYKVTHDAENFYFYFEATGEIGRTQVEDLANGLRAGRYYAGVTIDVDNDDATGFPLHDGGYYPSTDGWDFYGEIEYYNGTFNTGHYLQHGANNDAELEQAFADQSNGGYVWGGPATQGPFEPGFVNVIPGTYDYYTEWVYKENDPGFGGNDSVTFVEDRGPVVQGNIVQAVSADGHQMEMVVPFVGFLTDAQGNPIIELGKTVDLSFTLEASGELSNEVSATYPDGRWASDTAEPIYGYYLSYPDPEVRTDVLTGVTDQWQTVTLDHTYNSMVVAATVNLEDGDPPVVTRIRNAEGNSFEIKLQRTDGSTDPISAMNVHFIAVEEGIYTEEIHGITMEAIKFESSVTDSDSSWVGQEREYLNSYTAPVVLGQVMTENDTDFSAFWSRGATRTDIPDSSTLYVGKHVGEDSDTTRNDEAIGYIVIESGTGTINGLNYTAAVGADNVSGVGNSPAYNYNVVTDGTPVSAIATMSGMDGANGGWAVLYGSDALSANYGGNTIGLAIDEDIAKDSERSHTSEQVAYIVFSEAPEISAHDPELRTDVLTGVTDQWQTVTLDHTYDSMVVSATVNLESGDPNVVTRIRNADGNSFEIKLQRTDGTNDPIPEMDVHFIVVEEGFYTEEVHGIKMEAVKFESTVTDSNSSWQGEQRGYFNDYEAPVVLGQVMTENDSNFSVFWSRGSSRTEIPDSDTLYVGKHVGEDSNTIRNDEAIGYIVIESGSGTINGLNYTAGVGGDTVSGVGNSPGYNYTVDLDGLPVSAVASLSGMDGADGGWAVLYGGTPLTSSSIGLAIDEDTTSDTERSHTSEQVAYIIFSQEPEVSPYDPEIRTDVLNGVTDLWQTVTLDHNYNSMVVVATVNLQAGDPSVVARIRNASGNSFEIKLQRTDGSTDPIPEIDVHYIAVEEGLYTQEIHGIDMEAVKYDSTVTDENNSWVGEKRSYLNSYSAPVVIGQVMSENDTEFSVFWARGNSQTSPPSATDLYVGKHVGEDSNTARSDETIGYIVIESGSGTVDGFNYTAGLGSDTVLGVTNSPAYNYNITTDGIPVSAIASISGMDGGNGGWAVLYGENPLSTDTLGLAIDEDTANDTERNHTSEQVSYIVFSQNENLTPLDIYVNKVDESYEYSYAGTITQAGYTAYVLDMTSQTWRSIEEVDKPVWQHWVTIIVPDGATSETAVLFIDGGSNGKSQPTSVDTDALNFALGSGLITVHVPTIPSEPLIFADEGFPRTEDEIIAYTFDKWLNGGDDEWPLLLPMVKSAVAGMDTAQDYAQSALSTTINNFIVTGASKRGWTTWLTAAVDSRVKGIAPLVIDVLNMDENMKNHVDHYQGVTDKIIGGYSDSVHDYVDLNIMDRLYTPKGQELLKIVDPYEYRDRLTMPKFLVNGTNDQFFVPDSSQFYFHDLVGPSYLRYVPNADHGLDATALTDINNYFMAVAADATLPEFSWTIEEVGQTIRLETIDTPVAVNLWQRTNLINSDFRQNNVPGSFTSTVLADSGGGEYVAHVHPPASGATAFFIEVIYNVNGHQIRFTTDVSVLFPVPSEIELSDLQSANGGDGSEGFIIHGVDAGDRSGHTVSSAGDINGDGFDDFIISAVYVEDDDDPDNLNRHGISYVIFGKENGFPAEFELADLLAINGGDGSEGFVINPISMIDVAGGSVSSAGDINDDGFDDIILGAPGNAGSGYNAGAAFVIFGKASGYSAELDLSSLDGTNGFVIPGLDASDYAGYGVGSAGDHNGDGIDDIVIGAVGADPNGNSEAGETYVIFGKTSGYTASFDLSTLNGINGYVINGIDANDVSGASITTAGDINGDGFDDLLIGSADAAPNGNAYGGETYVIFGKASGFPASLNLSSLLSANGGDGSVGFVIKGNDTGDLSGYSVSTAGDLNNDGYDDILIGAFGGLADGTYRVGESYLIFGKASGYTAEFELSSLFSVNGGDGSAGVVINGISDSDRSGISVSSAGDVNGDGYSDLLIGASTGNGSDNTIDGAGEAYLLYGREDGFVPEFNLEDLIASNGGDGYIGIIFYGIDVKDETGYGVSGAGDINGDGFDDLIIGARYADPNGNAEAGETYIIFGRDFRNEDIHPLVVNGTPPAGTEAVNLTEEELQPVFNEAISRWSNVADSSELGDITISISDLNGQLLAKEQNGHITVDSNAAGFGWFVDSTPEDDSEFSYDQESGQFVATAPEATGKIDLLSVLMHEIGHALGFEHHDIEEHVMNSRLDAGTRSVDISDIDSFFSDDSQLAVVLDS